MMHHSVPVDPSPPWPSVPSHRPKSLCPTSQNHVECTTVYIYAITSFLFLLTFQSLLNQRTPTQNGHPLQAPPFERLQQLRPPPPPPPLSFHPLIDKSVPPYRERNRTWFMSTLTGRPANGLPEHFVFPSQTPHDKVLCVDVKNKSYALGSPEHGFPQQGAVLRGLTFVADSFYDYENPWHGLNAVAPFLAWMTERGGQRRRCERPARLVLFKNGEPVRRVGRWVRGVIEAALGTEVAVDGLKGYGVAGGPAIACFERAVVMRRGLGAMEGKKRREVFEMVRCKAWEHCGIDGEGEGTSGQLQEEPKQEEKRKEKVVHVSLLSREGRRGFKNESMVKEVIERECSKVAHGGGCAVRVLHFDNMTFCDQVRLMKQTHVLATTHGAQLTNMVFMEKGSSVMEMFPTGWLEGAGVGQYIYQWFASWSEMAYEGAWRDPDGLRCAALPPAKCFLMQKDQAVGVDASHLARWTAEVVARSAARRNNATASSMHPPPGNCTCACGH